MLPALMAAVLAAMPLQTVPQDDVRLQAAAREARFQRQGFEQAGFPPIAEARPQALRRLVLADPYMMLGVPGIELARDHDGRTTLTVQYRGWRSEPTVLDSGVWDELMPDAAVFAPRPVGPVSRGGPPPPVCHAWSAAIQSADGRIGNWHGCSGIQGPVREAALQMITLAMSTRPDCAFDAASPFFAFETCFRARPELDDPELEAVFAPLRAAHDAAPTADRLLQARQALQALGDRPGDADWSRAQEAVARVRAVNDERRDRLQRLIQLDFGAPNASAADKARMRQTLENWSSFQASQNQNYIALLEELLQKSGRPDA